MGVFIKFKHWFMLCFCHCSAENNVIFILDQIITAPILCGWMTMLQWTLMICSSAELPWGHGDIWISLIRSCTAVIHGAGNQLIIALPWAIIMGIFIQERRPICRLIPWILYTAICNHIWVHNVCNYFDVSSQKTFWKGNISVLNAVNGFGVTCPSHQNICNMFGVFLKLFQSKLCILMLHLSVTTLLTMLYKGVCVSMGKDLNYLLHFSITNERKVNIFMFFQNNSAHMYFTSLQLTLCTASRSPNVFPTKAQWWMRRTYRPS